MVKLLFFLLIVIIFVNFKQKITGQTRNNGTKNVNIVVLLKYVSNFWRTLEMLLINCEINLILTWSVNCLLVAGTVANQVPTYAATDTKLYVPLVTLSTQVNAKLLEAIEFCFKRTIIWNKYQSKITTQVRNLIGPNFQGVNSLFVLSYGNIKQYLQVTSNIFFQP